MKSKKGVFANTSTGYGKSKHNNNRHNGKSGKQETIKDSPDKSLQHAEQEADLNSGFGDYLRSPEAVEMMKLFVFANTIMLIVTMAWPNIKEQYYMFMQWLSTFETEQ